jgi:hypothetical protein
VAVFRKYSEKSLQLLLEQEFGCVCDGKPIAPPYCSEDDQYTYYISPDGLHFSVPPPIDGLGYSLGLVDDIIKAAELNVVVNLSEKKLKKAESED